MRMIFPSLAFPVCFFIGSDGWKAGEVFKHLPNVTALLSHSRSAVWGTVISFSLAVAGKRFVTDADVKQAVAS